MDIKTKTLSFEISNEAYAIIEKTAQIKEQSVQEYIERNFSWAELIKHNQKEIDKHLKFTLEKHQRIKNTKIYNSHPLQEYILEYFLGTKNVKKTIDWRTCPVLEDAEKHREYDPDSFCNHVGEYWYQIRKFKKGSLGMFREIDTTKTYYFKSLKALKRNINKVFGYNHYKVK